MRKVYRLDYYEPYEPDFKYEEVFALGFYESRERCLEEIETHYKNQPGFKEGTIENYRITEMIMDEMVVPEVIQSMRAEKDSDQLPNRFWELLHGYETEDGFTVCTDIGVYSRKEWAEVMKRIFETWPIFKLHNDPELGFFVDLFILNRRCWEGGFNRAVPLDDASDESTEE